MNLPYRINIRTIQIMIFALLYLMSQTVLPQKSQQVLQKKEDQDSFINGINYCSYWHNDYLNEYSTRSINKIKETENNWISILVTWYQENESATSIAADSSRSPTDEALLKAISDAKAQDLKIALKPHVDLLNGEWRGHIGRGVSNEDFDEFFNNWFSSYKQFIDHYVAIAVAENIDMVFIGTEYVEILSRDDGKTIPHWISYINQIRNTYNGKLSYCADRQHWQNVPSVQQKIWFKPFWQALDYIGIDAYYSLGSEDEPTVDQLVAEWQLPISIIEEIHLIYEKPVLVSEVGYRSITKCHIDPWDYSVDRPVSEESQKRCYGAFYRAFKGKEWLEGVFWWNWIPYLESDITNPSSPDWVKDKLSGYQKGYTPEGKLAESVLSQGCKVTEIYLLY